MAEIYWIGNATPIKQVTTIAVTGTWATSDTATLTINGQDLTVTIGSDTAIADVVAAIVAAFNATSATASLVNDESRNVGGAEIPEFRRITASGTASPITLTADYGGEPFTVTASESTAGSGALGTPSNTTAATGPTHWDQADNWSGGSVPVNSDDVIIDSRAVSSIKHGLDQSAVTLSSLSITSGFGATLQIGLPEVNNDEGANFSYGEYRDTSLQIGATNLNIGEGDNPTMSKRIQLDLGSVQTAAVIYRTGTRADSAHPACLIVGTHASNTIDIMNRADVGIAFYNGESATFATVNSSGRLTIGDSVTLTNVDVNGGTTTCWSNTTTVDIHGGTFVAMAGTHTDVDVYADGTLDFRSGTVTTCKLSGSLAASLSTQSKTITNELEAYAGATIDDPSGSITWSNGFQLNHCRIEDVTIDVGINKTFTVS